MAPTPVTFAVLVASLLLVDAQLSPGLLNDKTVGTETEDGVRGSSFDDPRKKERLFQLDKPYNESDYRRPEGDRYSWEHDLGTGATVSERAFAANGSSTIVVKSRDRALETLNITRATSVYSFSEGSSVVAIIPWRRSGPCLIKNTTLTYQGAIDLLTARNGSTVPTTSKVSLDGNVAPLNTEEAKLFLELNPGLRRACNLRPIIITVEFEDNFTPFSNSTEEILTLTLEADVKIIVPELPEFPDAFKSNEAKDGSRQPWGQGNRWGNWQSGLTDQGGRQNKTQA